MVLKILSKDILHKSDAGEVKIILGIEDEAQRAFNEIITSRMQKTRLPEALWYMPTPQLENRAERKSIVILLFGE